MTNKIRFREYGKFKLDLNEFNLLVAVFYPISKTKSTMNLTDSPTMISDAQTNSFLVAELLSENFATQWPVAVVNIYGDIVKIYELIFLIFQRKIYIGQYPAGFS